MVWKWNAANGVVAALATSVVTDTPSEIAQDRREPPGLGRSRSGAGDCQLS